MFDGFGPDRVRGRGRCNLMACLLPLPAQPPARHSGSGRYPSPPGLPVLAEVASKESMSLSLGTTFSFFLLPEIRIASDRLSVRMREPR